MNAQKIENEALKWKDFTAKNYLSQLIDHSNPETILCKDTFRQSTKELPKQKYHNCKRSELILRH